MKQSEIQNFCNYEVYEYVDGKYHPICLCNDHKTATIIAQRLALADTNHDVYYVSGIDIPDNLVIGGGWYECYWTNERGKLEKGSVG